MKEEADLKKAHAQAKGVKEASGLGEVDWVGVVGVV